MEIYDVCDGYDVGFRANQHMQGSKSFTCQQNFHKASGPRYESETCNSSRCHGPVKPSFMKQNVSNQTALKFRHPPSASGNLQSSIKGPSAYYTIQNQQPLNLAQVIDNG